ETSEMKPWRGSDSSISSATTATTPSSSSWLKPPSSAAHASEPSDDLEKPFESARYGNSSRPCLRNVPRAYERSGVAERKMSPWSRDHRDAVGLVADASFTATGRCSCSWM